MIITILFRVHGSLHSVTVYSEILRYSEKVIIISNEGLTYRHSSTD